VLQQRRHDVLELLLEDGRI